MSKKRKMTRREFLHASAVVAAGAASAACAVPTATPTEEEATPKPTATTKPEATPKPAAKYNEAPMLTELVEAGELPPVDERLPTEPLVVRPERNQVPSENIDLEVGRYGGELRMAQPAPAWHPDIFVMNDESLLFSPGILAEDVGPGVAKSFEVSEDGKAFIFHMRKGLEWSDGEPVTSEDVQFTYEDVLLNEKITPTFPKWMKTGNSAEGEPLKLEVLDEYSFRISFSEPYAGFPAWLSIIQWKGYTEFVKPKHHLKQFHADYTPIEELEPLIKEEELAEGEWWTLFNQKDVLNWELCDPEAIDFPTLNPWMLVEHTPTMSVYERNPYYFKVDAEGNQLPYIDGIRSRVVEDVEAVQMRVVAGEIDFLREDATLDNVPLYKENAEKGGYSVHMLDMHVTPVDAELNLTYEDPTWRQVVRDVRFRKALSLGLDRAEIIDTVYKGFTELPKAVPSEYNPDKANALLDEMGMTERDKDGFRLGPDGETFVIPFEICKAASDFVPVTELYVQHWKKLGIKTTMKVIECGLRGTREEANKLKATMGWHHGPELWWGALWDYHPGGWGQLWWEWFTSAGEEGEEPPEEVKKLMELINRSVVTSGQERDEAIEGFRRLMYDNVWIIVTCENTKYPMIASDKLGNIADAGFAITANFAGEQMYFKE